MSPRSENCAGQVQLNTDKNPIDAAHSALRVQLPGPDDYRVPACRPLPTGRNLAKARRRLGISPHAQARLHAACQRQGRALHPERPACLGLRPCLRQGRAACRAAIPSAAPLQRASPHGRRDGSTRDGRPARHAGTRPARARARRTAPLRAAATAPAARLPALGRQSVPLRTMLSYPVRDRFFATPPSHSRSTSPRRIAGGLSPFGLRPNSGRDGALT